MVVALISQTSADTGFSVAGLIVVAIVFAAVYPLQKRLRAAASRQRRERWAREGLMPVERPQAVDGPGAPDGSGAPAGPDDRAAAPDDERRPGER